MEQKKESDIELIGFMLFTALLAGLGLLFFVTPARKSSEYEKRNLAPLPHFSSHSLLKGKYTDSLDQYVSDNFPMRDDLVKFSFSIAGWRGFRSKEVRIFKPLKPHVAKDTALAKKGLPDSVNVADQSGEMNDGIFISENRAMELFGGSSVISRNYAAMVNLYQSTLSASGVTVYSAVIPSPAEFYMPEKYKKYSNPQRKNIDRIYSQITAPAKGVDAYSEIAAHADQYLYFNTDHHWTGLGAYYAYRAFCADAGFVPYELSSLKKKTIRRFLGSLYYQTLDQTLKDHIDSVEYWKIPVTYKAWRFNGSKPVSMPILAEFASGGNAYAVFLGGDFPLLKIATGAANGRKAILIKNSYGNPFGTWLIPHYEELYIIDYRYYSGKVSDLVKENGITDVIFLNGIFSANTQWHVYKMKSILGGTASPAAAKPAAAPKTAAVPKDTTKKTETKK